MATISPAYRGTQPAQDVIKALLASDGEIFFTTPHYDGYPTVLVHLEAIGVEELTELITDSWLIKAPPKLRRRLESQ